MKKEKLKSLLNPDFDWNKAIADALEESHVMSLEMVCTIYDFINLEVYVFTSVKHQFIIVY